MEGDHNTTDEEHRHAFGEHTNMSEECRYEINQIKNNDPNCKSFEIDDNDVENFSDLAWELLSRYIAENNHLENLYIYDAGLTDETMILLFKYLTRSTSLKKLFLPNNNFGLDGIQSMIPFLKNAPNLKSLKIWRNDNINADFFSLLISGLYDGPIEDLDFRKCSIEDITALETYSLPHLKILNFECNNIRIIPSLDKYTNLEELQLYGNSIGRQGCRSIANLLQNNSSRLRVLYLACNDIGDEEAEILADSLKHNTTLKKLTLGWNKLKEKGLRALLKLLNDISSIANTYNSNHTLTDLGLSKSSPCSKCAEMKKHILSSLTINRCSDAPSQQKVIETQLNSVLRMELCHLQGIEYSYNSIFANIDDVFLPNIIALVGRKHGQDELYRMLIATAPDLTSIVNRRAVLPERIAENVAQEVALGNELANRLKAMHAALAALKAENVREIDALAAKRLEMERELESFESGGQGHPMVDTKNLDSVASSCGKKRSRGD